MKPSSAADRKCRLHAMCRQKIEQGFKQQIKQANKQTCERLWGKKLDYMAKILET